MCILDVAVQGAHCVCSSLADLLFPEHCLLTGVPLERGMHLLPSIDDAAMLFHATAPPPIAVDLLLQRHVHADELMITSVMALWSVSTTSTIDTAVYAIKYHHRTQLAQDLGALLGEHPHVQELPSSCMLCPIPIHIARRRERGYNQAECIAQGIARTTGLQVLGNGVLRRSRYTQSQTTKSDRDRLTNVNNAFVVTDAESVRGRHIILVDDVVTTGATVNACATALVMAGARRVDVAALCIAV